MNIVLLNPEIPYNTGNIGRTAVLTNTKIHLIKPLGFSLDEKDVKRAGLDYWHLVDLIIWESYEDFVKKNPNINIYYATTKTNQKYSDISFKENDYIMFGPESSGIPEILLNQNKNKCITIPMIDMGRSLNLSNAVAIILYEGLRQLNFAGFK